MVWKTGLALWAALLLANTSPAQADRMAQRMARAGCDPATVNIIAERSRQELENSVMIAEQAVEPPRAVGDLGCLDNLLDIDIDTFSPILIDPLSALDKWIDGIGRALCNFAEQQWAQATAPITSITGEIDSLQSVLDPTSWLPAPGTVVREATRNVNVGTAVQQGANEVLAPAQEEVQDGVNRRREDVWDSILGTGSN